MLFYNIRVSLLDAICLISLYSCIVWLDGDWTLNKVHNQNILKRMKGRKLCLAQNKINVQQDTSFLKSTSEIVLCLYAAKSLE